MSRVNLDFIPGKIHGKLTWGRKDEEFLADFCLVARRALADDEYRVFKYHFLYGADWRLCCRRLDIDKGTFFHMVYRIEQRLGRTFRELEPHALYPIDQYYAGGRQEAQVSDPPEVQKVISIESGWPPRKQRKLSEEVPLRKLA